MNRNLYIYNMHTLDIVQDKFGVRPIKDSPHELTAAVYLQVSIVSQALIFVTRSRSWSFLERPGLLLVAAFLVAQLVTLHYIFIFHCHVYFYIKLNQKLTSYLVMNVYKIATFIAVYANWDFARIKGMGWGWAGVIWLYSIIFYFPLDILKFIVRYALSGKAWDNLLQNKVC